MDAKDLKKRIRNIENKQEDLGCHFKFPPLYNQLDCIRLKSSKERLEKKLMQLNEEAKAAKKPAEKKSKPAEKKSKPAEKKSKPKKLPGRPPGRPPMKCEDIAKKTQIKDPVKKQAAVDKKCEKRGKKTFAPYKCTNVDGKCMTISKTYENPLFNQKKE